MARASCSMFLNFWRCSSVLISTWSSSASHPHDLTLKLPVRQQRGQHGVVLSPARARGLVRRSWGESSGGDYETARDAVSSGLGPEHFVSVRAFLYWHGQLELLGMEPCSRESDETIIVEGNHYFPPASVNREYFGPSVTHTFCPWKWTASYYSVDVEGSANTGRGLVLPPSHSTRRT